MQHAARKATISARTAQSFRSYYTHHHTGSLTMASTSSRPDARLNPAYVLSAICMIFGLFALNGSLDFSPLLAHNLLLLIGVLNAYEALTLLIAWVLHRRGIAVDARTLLVIESLFLFDGAFLTSELITVMPSVGGPIGLCLLLGAVLKTWVVLRIAGVRLVSRTGTLAMLMLALLLALPWTYQQVSDANAGELTAGGYYAGWWMIAVAPAAAAVLWRRNDPAIVHVIVGIGMASLLAHVGTAAWVHKVDFSLANLAPAVLAIALLVGHGRLARLDHAGLVRFELLVPVLAVLMSARPPAELQAQWVGVAITPLRLALVTAALVYVHGWLRHRDWSFAVALIGGGTLAAAGATTQAIGTTFGQLIRGAIRLATSLIPRTLTQWGWVSVGCAFAFMIGGAMLSMRRAAREADEPDAPPPAEPTSPAA
jgi:hypothetical protein